MIAVATAPAAIDRDALVVAHEAWARKLARNFARRYPALADECESAALLGLVEAAGSFDPARGASFKTHARSRVVGAMGDEVRKWAPKGFARDWQRAKFGPTPVVRHLSAVAVEDGDGDRHDLAERLADDESGPVGWELEYHDEVAALARRLVGGPGGEAVRAMFTEAGCYFMKAAGLAVGLSESRVSQILSFAAERACELFPDPTEIFMSGAHRLNGLLEPITLHHDGPGDDAADAPEQPLPTADESDADLVRRYAASHPGLNGGQLSRLIESETGRKLHHFKVLSLLGRHPGASNGRKAATRQAAPEATGTDPAGPPGPASDPLAARVEQLFRDRPGPAPAPPMPPPVAIAAPAPPPPASPVRRELAAMGAIADALEGLRPAEAARVLAWAAGRFGAEG